MRKAFKSLDYSLKSAENSLLELARYYGIFGEMVHSVDGSTEYQIGPRGLTTQKCARMVVGGLHIFYNLARFFQ